MGINFWFFLRENSNNCRIWSCYGKHHTTMVSYGTLVQEEIIDLSLRNNFFIIWLCGGVIKAEQGQFEQTSPRLPVDINGSKHFPIEIGSSSIYIYYKVEIHNITQASTKRQLLQKRKLMENCIGKQIWRLFFDDLFLFWYDYSF